MSETNVREGVNRRDFQIEGNTVVFFRLKEYHAKSKLHVIKEPVWYATSDDKAKLHWLGRRWKNHGKLGRPAVRVN